MTLPMPTAGPTGSGEDGLVPIIEELTTRLQAGERVDVEEYVRTHPEYAERLRDLVPALGVLADLGQAPLPEAPAEPTSPPLAGQLGDFRLLREVGRGGMGVVYEAEQISLGRRVALKVLPFAAALDARQLQRFKNEAQAAAGLHHQNIVPVHYVGCERGVHYYAMQFIDGRTLASVVHELRRQAGLERGGQAADAPPPHPTPLAPGGSGQGEGAAGPPSTRAARALSTERSARGPALFRTAAQLGVQAAEALESAHQVGVIHRDIKPANLLVDVRGHLWVTDFGLAHCQSQPGLTTTGDVLGTLRYMSPEQALGKHGLVDHRTDIYSLGVTLYELLALRPAFDGGDRQKLLRQVGEEEPPPLRRLNPAVPAELETIVAKAMAKEAPERYGAARELADDLNHWLRGEPIRARSVGRLGRLWRWCRRNPALAGLSGFASALLLVIALGSLLAALLLRQETEKARLAERAATDRAYRALFAQAQASRWSGRAGQRFESLKALQAAAEIATSLNRDAPQLLDLRTEAIACMALTDVRIARQWDGYPAGSSALSFDARLERYALSDRQGTVRVYRTGDAQELARLPGPGGVASDLRFSPDGRFLAVTHSPGKVRVWDIPQRQLLFETPWTASDSCLDWSPDSRWVAVGLPDFSIGVYEVPSGKEVKRQTPGTIPNRLALHPDGRRVALSNWHNNSVQVRDLAAGVVLHEFTYPRAVLALCWSPDGRSLACGCMDGQIDLWDQTDGRHKPVLQGHQMGVRGVTFNHAGDLLASHGWDGTLRVWNPRTGKHLVSCPGAARSPQFSPDDKLLAGVVHGSELVLLQVAPGREYRSLDTEAPDLVWDSGLDFSPDGRLLASAGGDGVRLWDLAVPSNVARLSGARHGAVLFQADGSGLIAWGDSELRRWPLESESSPGAANSPAGPGLRVGPPRTLYLPAKTGSYRTASWAADRRWLALTDRSDGQAVILNVEKPEERVLLREHHRIAYVAMSPDGNWVATGARHGHGVKVWDARGGRLVKELPLDEASVAFSPDNRWLVTGTPAEYVFWEVGLWQPHWRIPRSEASSPGCTAFTGDGKTLALCSSDQTIQLLDVATRSPLATLSAPEPEMILCLRFDAEGSQLAAATQNNSVQLWDLRRLRGGLAAVGLDWGGPALPPRRGGADPRPLAFHFAAAESPGRLEAEELRVLDQEDCATWTQDMNDYDRDQWSRGRQLIGHAGRDGHVTLRVDLPTAGKYRLLICFTKAPNYGILEVSLDGKGIGGRFDGFHPRVVPSGRVDFGLVELTKGTHAVRFTVVGKNRASDNYYMGIDCLELRPVD